MSDAPGIGIDEPPETPADILARLKLTLSQLPFGPFGPVIDLNPPDVMSPVIIVPALVAMQARYNSLSAQLDSVEHLLMACKSLGVPPPAALATSMVDIEMNILKLQQDYAERTA